MRTDLDMIARVTGLLNQAVSAVSDAELGHPTPCADWNVTALLEHITGGNRFTSEILQGHTANDALTTVRASFIDDVDPRSAVLNSASIQLASFQAEDVMQGMWHHVAGELTGEQVARLRIHDMNIHLWDLVVAVHPKKGLDPVYVRWAIDELAQPDSLTARHMATGFPNPSKPYELLLAFGRRRPRPGEHLRRSD